VGYDERIVDTHRQREENVNPILKRTITAIAVKKAWDRYQQARRPQRPSLWARLWLPAVLLTTGGALAFLGKSGRLGPVVDQMRGKAKRGESESIPPPAPPA
jgi:hypothetical protein